MEALETLKTKKSWAVIGVTPKQEKYGYRIYKKLQELHKDVYGVSPIYSDIEGVPTYPNLGAIKDPIDVVVFVVNKKLAVAYFEEMAQLHLSTAWLQPGTYDEASLAAIPKDIAVIRDCVLFQSEFL